MGWVGVMGTCFCVLSHFMEGGVKRRGDGMALGVLGGTATGSRQIEGGGHRLLGSGQEPGAKCNERPCA